jgi:thymidylate synthase
VASKSGKINSNYGFLIYSDECYNQFNNAFQHLLNDKESRRATMIFNRPSIHKEWNHDGMSDFICSLAFSFFIRDNKLIGVYNWRSEDFIYGLTGSDFFFAATIYDRMFDKLNEIYNDITKSFILWNVNSLHVYERHFYMLKAMFNGCSFITTKVQEDSNVYSKATL